MAGGVPVAEARGREHRTHRSRKQDAVGCNAVSAGVYVLVSRLVRLPAACHEAGNGPRQPDMRRLTPHQPVALGLLGDPSKVKQYRKWLPGRAA